MGMEFCKEPACLEFAQTNDPTCEDTLKFYCAPHEVKARARGETGVRPPMAKTDFLDEGLGGGGDRERVRTSSPAKQATPIQQWSHDMAERKTHVRRKAKAIKDAATGKIYPGGVHEVAEVLNLKPHQVYTWIQQGKMAYVAAEDGLASSTGPAATNSSPATGSAEHPKTSWRPANAEKMLAEDAESLKGHIEEYKDAVVADAKTAAISGVVEAAREGVLEIKSFTPAPSLTGVFAALGSMAVGVRRLKLTKLKITAGDVTVEAESLEIGG